MIDLEQLAVLAGAAAMAACSLDPEAARATAALDICDIFVCGGNAAQSGDGFIFDELNLAGAYNYADVRITHTTLGNPVIPVTLGVDRHFFFATDGAGTDYRGPELIGTIISFQHASGDKFEVRFAGYNMQSLRFRTGDTTDFIPVYLLQVRRLGESKWTRFVCNNSVILDDPSWTIDPHYALVYGGDRYSPTEKRVISSSTKSPWAILACAGSGGTKLHMNRHTLAGSIDYAPGGGPGPVSFPTSIDQRTALMKAITADYCGDGATTFTVSGQPLTYAGDQPWWIPPSLIMPWPVQSIEAIWDHTGAVCVDTPRHVSGTVSCGGVAIPACGGAAGWTAHYAITANPAP